MISSEKRTWAEIDLNICRKNVMKIKNMIGDSKLLYIIKADAYGHGAEEVSKAVCDIVDCFGVATLGEALDIRRYGITNPILVLGFSPVTMADELIKQDIIQTVYSYEYGKQLAENMKDGQKLKIHIKIDTGMSRLGFSCQGLEDIEKSCTEIKRLFEETAPKFEFEGIFTHFAVADSMFEEDIDFTEKQFERFMSVTERLKKEGVCFPVRHCCNSAGILNYPKMHLDMVRPGLILYGALPDKCKNEIGLEPVMRIKSVIIQIRTVNKGDTVGYGRKFTAKDKRMIATVPMGYADGLSRLLSNKISVLINGCFAPIVGNICMDQFMVDVTGIPGLEAGQIVTIIGREGDKEIIVNDLTDKIGMISYEFLTGVGNRVSREYKRVKSE